MTSLTNVVPHGCGLACIVNHVVPMLTASSTFLWPESEAADFCCFATRTDHIDLKILKQDLADNIDNIHQEKLTSMAALCK